MSCARYIADPMAWESPGIGRSMFFLLYQTVSFFLMIFFLESGRWKSIRQALYSQTLGLVAYKMVSSDVTWLKRYVNMMRSNIEFANHAYFDILWYDSMCANITP